GSGIAGGLGEVKEEGAINIQVAARWVRGIADRKHLLHVNLVALRMDDDAGRLNTYGRRRACSVVNGDVNLGLATVIKLNRGVIIHILKNCLEEVKRIGGEVAGG